MKLLGLLVFVACFVGAFAQTATFGCGPTCKAGQLTPLTYEIPALAATGDPIDLVDLSILINIPINATINSGTMCTVSQSGVTLAYSDMFGEDNEYDPVTSFITKTNIRFQAFTPLTETDTLIRTAAVTFKCDAYFNAPYSMASAYKGSIAFIDGERDQTMSFSNIAFPILTTNTLTGTAVPEPRAQYADGNLVFTFASIPFPIREYDMITINIPSSLYLWNKTNPAICSYGGVPMEYYVSDAPVASPNKITLIAPSNMDNNEGYMRFSCEVKKHTYTNDVGQVFSFPALPAASAFDAAPKTVTIEVKSLPDYYTNQSVTRYTGQVTLEPTVIPTLGNALSVYAVPNYANAPNPTVILAITPLTPQISTGQTLKFTLPSGWSIDSTVTTPVCKAGFRITDISSATKTGTTVLKAVGGGVEVSFTTDSDIMSSEASSATFRLFCQGIKLPTTAAAAGTTSVTVTAAGEEYGVSTGVTVEAVAATESDPVFIKHTIVIAANRAIFSSEFPSILEAYAQASGIATTYLQLGQQIFYPAVMDGETVVTSPYVEIDIYASTTNEYVLSELHTIVNQRKKAVADGISKNLAMVVYNDRSTVTLTTISAACVGAEATCGGECFKCDTGAACQENSDCLSLRCQEGVCHATKNSAGVAGMGAMSVMVVVVAIIATFMAY